jgi:acetyltransferase-like isoleucine patch superfamily enzyme
MPVASDVTLGRGVIVFHPELVNLYGCRIGDGTRIGSFVEIQKNATIGSNCKISSHTFICEGVEIEDEVFVGHGVKFVNDLYPRATTVEGRLQGEADWKILRTVVRRSASIGTNATILANLTIGPGAMIGAAALVVKDVPDYAIVAGVPGRVIGDVRESEKARRC